ncbi:phosphotransferase [Kitasatospora sp. NPDC058190]|uniref:phosphotransferase n=1 Tax=Kitasatospora sp. NPDC058190 TaxID=3346371 RepID=UPI0036DAC679
MPAPPTATPAPTHCVCSPRPGSAFASPSAVLGEAFGLGEVRACRFLSDGLLNGNWRLDAAEGSFALKRIMDVPLPVARRNLAVLSALADDGLPVGRARLSGAGDAVVEVTDRGYCLIPWMEGSHLPGTALSIGQAADLGVLLGRIHRSLNGERLAGLLPPGPEQVTARVTTPPAARAEADRFLALIAELENRTAFDDEATSTGSAALASGGPAVRAAAAAWAGRRPPASLRAASRSLRRSRKSGCRRTRALTALSVLIRSPGRPPYPVEPATAPAAPHTRIHRRCGGRCRG